MDIIQEAKERIELAKECKEFAESRGIFIQDDADADLISRLVDMLEWKSIDSAPLDTRILGCSKIEYTHKQKIPIGGEVHIVSGYEDKQYGRTFAKGNGTNFIGITHWLPLPPVGDK